MLDIAGIEAIARQVADAHVAGSGLERIAAASITDSTGEDALRITLVLAPDAVRRLTGDDAIDLLSDIQARLQEADEMRFAFVEYATEQELRAEAESAADAP